MDDQIAIRVDHVSKVFKLPHEKNSSIKSALINFRKRRTYERQKALEDISFEVRQGEFFGIVGRNGSGKSTLLKLIAGIYSPTKGNIQLNGQLTPFIELGVGFNPELTGRENVFLNGALLGFSRKQMALMYDDIVEFAELGKFMDQKLKNYSSGMQVRLAFSIAIRAKSDILLIDEVLAVGDTAFQRKCYEVFRQMKEEGRTIVFVTHDMQAVERFCDKAMVVSKGKVTHIDKPSKITTVYDRLNAEYEGSEQPKTDVSGSGRWGSGLVKVEKVTLLAGDKKPKEPVFDLGKPFSVQIDLKNPQHQDVIIGLAIEDQFGINVAGPNSTNLKLKDPRQVTYRIKHLPLLPGQYRLTVVVFDAELVNEYDHLEKSFSFRVVSHEHHLHGKVNLFGDWQYESNK